MVDLNQEQIKQLQNDVNYWWKEYLVEENRTSGWDSQKVKHLESCYRIHVKTLKDKFNIETRVLEDDTLQFVELK